MSPPLRRVSLNEARRLVDWRLRQPARLPDGYRLSEVFVGELHAFAAGPTVVMHFARDGLTDDRAAQHLTIVQLRAIADVPEDVAPDAARRLRAGSREALFIDGRWVEQDGRRIWRRGDLVRLILEDGDLVIQVQADPRDGWSAERLADVAASLR